MSTDRQTVLKRQLQLIDGQSSDPSAPSLHKHRKMALSPFQFFRGSAQLFYADLASGVLTLPSLLAAKPGMTTIMGDCHLANFGFLTEEGSQGDQVIFSPNDFDDACMGYAVWDIARFLTSVALVADLGRGILDGRYISDGTDSASGSDYHAPDNDAVVAACRGFLHAYSDTLQKVIVDSDMRYKVLKKFPDDHTLYKTWRKACKRAAGGKDFLTKSQLAKSTRFEGGVLRFVDEPEKYQVLAENEVKEVAAVFRPYLDDDILDCVARLGAGTGSNNMERYYLLVGPEDLHSLDELAMCHIVEIKQQRQAAPIFAFPDISPVNKLNPAHLTADCQRNMQRRPDLLLDEVVWRGKHWLVRSRHHARAALKPDQLVVTRKDPAIRLSEYAQSCGEALALAHSRGDRRSSRFELFMVESLANYIDEMIEVCLNYSEQVIADHALHVAMLD
ncbi:DUF2252 family protein [Photobacterium sp. GSS17]|uniref:DUF2252 family protein n=1 Tax=Photobacterium sp. GSS17 TaxID=3020715 RepID=UPI002360093C|nr:DUF2252 family protein [Photobacterium sp. GSS17]